MKTYLNNNVNFSTRNNDKIKFLKNYYEENNNI